MLGSAAGRLAATGAMLAAAAAVVVTAGGTGLLGPLGALIAGGSRTAVEREAGAGAGGAAPAGAIVALASSAAAPPGGRVDGRRGPGRGRGVPGPGRGAPVGTSPGTSAPGFPGFPGGAGPPGGPGDGGGGGPSPAPPPRRGAVETAGEAVREIGRQAPAPAQPLVREAERVTGGLTETCRRLPVCP